MNAKIKSILPNSLAEELGIEVGDIILSINGTEVKDIIDFRFLMSDDYVEIEVQKPDGEVWDIEAEKDITLRFKGSRNQRIIKLNTMVDNKSKSVCANIIG